MINHIRTLLLNHSREGHPLDGFGEEYIPINYTPHQLSGAVALAHTSIFGSKPDRLFLNYRARQLMQLIHGSELAGDVLQSDPRITYLPFQQDLFEEAFRIQIKADGNYPVYVVGEHKANDQRGVCTQNWMVTLNTNTVTVLHQTQNTTTTVPRNEPVVLPGSALTLSAPSAPNGAIVRVRSNGRPQLDAGTLLRLVTQLLSEQGIAEILGGNYEPIQTWRTIWQNGQSAISQFAALLMALAYRIEQSPQGSQ
jgi:hypothetical protein